MKKASNFLELPQLLSGPLVFRKKKEAKIDNNQGEFKRFEEKYLLNEEQFKAMERVFYLHSEPHYPTPGTKYTLIESLYFDGPNLEFHQEYFQSLPERYKLRVRRYAPNGTWTQDAPLVELKYKKLNPETGKKVCKKKRFCITQETFESLKAGKTIELTPELFNLNKNISLPKMEKLIKRVNKLIRNYKLSPSMSVQYKRQAFQKDNFRFTIDGDITAKSMRDICSQQAVEIKSEVEKTEKSQKMASYEKGQNFILELKHSGTIPFWMEKELEKQNIAKTTFSKYSWSISNLLTTASYQAV